MQDTVFRIMISRLYAPVMLLVGYRSKYFQKWRGHPQLVFWEGERAGKAAVVRGCDIPAQAQIVVVNGLLPSGQAAWLWQLTAPYLLPEIFRICKRVSEVEKWIECFLQGDYEMSTASITVPEHETSEGILLTEKHIILVVGSYTAEYTPENLWMTRDPRMCRWPASEVRSNRPLPDSVEYVVYFPKELGAKRAILDALIREAGGSVRAWKVFHQGACEEIINNLIKHRAHPMAASPTGSSVAASRVVDEVVPGAESQRVQSIVNPVTSSSNGSAGLPESNGGGNLSGVKLPPAGEAWPLIRFVRENGNLNLRTKLEKSAEIDRLTALAAANGYPDVKRSNVAVYLNNLRNEQNAGGAGFSQRFEPDPAVEAFLATLNQLSGQIAGFAQALQAERAAAKTRIQGLEDEVARLNDLSTTARELAQKLLGTK